MDWPFIDATSQSVTQGKKAVEELDERKYQVNQAGILIAIRDEALDATVQQIIVEQVRGQTSIDIHLPFLAHAGDILLAGTNATK